MYTTTAVRYVHGAPKIWNACVPLLPHFHAASTGMCSLPGKSAQVIFGATAKLFTMWIHAFLRQHKCRQPPLTSRPSLATFSRTPSSSHPAGRKKPETGGKGKGLQRTAGTDGGGAAGAGGEGAPEGGAGAAAKKARVCKPGPDTGKNKLSTAQRLQLVNEIRRGAKRKVVAAKFNVGTSYVSKLMKPERIAALEKVRDLGLNQNALRAPLPVHDTLEGKVRHWFQVARERFKVSAVGCGCLNESCAVRIFHLLFVDTLWPLPQRYPCPPMANLLG